MTITAAPDAPHLATSATMSGAAQLAADGWLNAFSASGGKASMPVLARTVSIEFFPFQGIQFVGCNGHLLARTWMPAWESSCRMPDWARRPDAAIVVCDEDGFLGAFMRAVAAVDAKSDTAAQIDFTLSLDPNAEPSLSDELAPRVLTVTAMGQSLTMRVRDEEYPNWRGLQLGVPADVDAIAFAARYLQKIGKMRGASKVAMSFSGSDKGMRYTVYAADATIDDFIVAHGILMPMRDPDKKDADEPDEPDEPDDEDTSDAPDTGGPDRPDGGVPSVAELRALERLAPSARSSIESVTLSVIDGGKERASVTLTKDSRKQIHSRIDSLSSTRRP
jgi:hypothetical protein